jgi:hypothetical protein
MALILKDRVKESSSSSGTGNITLGGAFPGYQTFNAAIATGSTVYYTIHNLAAGFDTEWEVGVGTFTSPATLARNTVLSSSTGSTINFTAGTNGLEVFITQPAEEAVYLNQATGLVEIGGNGTNTVSFTNVNTTNLTATTVTLTAGTISTTPTNSTDITNKTYVDNLVSSGTHFHDPVRVESPVALTVTYNNGTDGVGATLTNAGAQAALVIDGVTLSVADRVLIYQQVNQTQNGVYVVTDVGSGATNWILTRSNDTDTFGLTSPDTLGEGSTFFVQQGNTGAGQTYTCNTVGTITFGTTNITFAQISSSQIYSAGTGLSLINLAFSISNTAVTAATYGDSGNVAQVTVNAQGQLTNAANVAINASSITTGTLPNAQTTASSSNGANTIVLRDSTGSFTANTITATDVNSTNVTATTGSFTNVSGNAATVTNINASNISSGTLDNARTTGNTANSASTIVLRDTNGSFGANIISGAFSGDGSAINAINASNISSGTIDNSRTSAASANGASTIVLRDGSGGFGAGDITSLSISGNGVALTAINASNIASGTIANARTTADSANGASTIVLRGASGEFAAGAITGTSVSGNGVALTAINASNISSGTVATARLGTGTANSATFLRGDQTYAAVPSPNNGTLTMNVSGTGLSGSATFTADQSGNSTFTVASNASSANGASTLVARDGSGNFTANVGTFTTVAGTLSTAAQTNITSVGSLGSTQISSLGVGTAASGTAGEIRATNNVTAFFSDERLKTKTGDIKNALDKVCQIETLLYHANEVAVALGYDASIPEVGVTAQSVQKVQPEIVVPAPIDDKYLTVRYEKLVPLLIEAIKELKAEIDALKGK